MAWKVRVLLEGVGRLLVGLFGVDSKIVREFVAELLGGNHWTIFHLVCLKVLVGLGQRMDLGFQRYYWFDEIGIGLHGKGHLLI